MLNKIKNILVAEKQDILSKITNPQEVDTEGDETDQIQGNMIIGINNQLNLRHAFKLKQINEALARIDIKTYAICEDCAEPIPEKRLLNNPCFTTCVDCAEEREFEAKKMQSN